MTFLLLYTSYVFTYKVNELRKLHILVGMLISFTLGRGTKFEESLKCDRGKLNPLKVKHSRVAQVVTKLNRSSLAARARAEVFDFSSGCNPYLFIDLRTLLKHRSFLT